MSDGVGVRLSRIVDATPIAAWFEGKAAQEQGISQRTVRSAKRNLASKLYVVRDGTQWMVSLLS